MKNLRTVGLAVLGVAAGMLYAAAPLRAQITEVARTPIADAAQVTFGYLCDDRFIIRNDGTRSIDLEYGLEKGTEHTRITLNARESVELNSPSKASMELWMDGKQIAKALKERRSCRDVQGASSSNVTVVPPNVQSNTPQQVTNVYTYGPPYPFYDPWAFGFYGSFGYRPYYSGVTIGFPIIIGGRGRRR